MEEFRLNNCNTILNLLLLINIRAKVKNIRKIRVEPDLVTFFWKKLVGRARGVLGRILAISHIMLDSTRST